MTYEARAELKLVFCYALQEGRRRSQMITKDRRRSQMITKDEIQELLHSTETYRVERTTSTGDMNKFHEAICAFANDLSGSRKKGYLILRAYDNGGNVGGKNGGDNVPSLSPVLSQVVTSLSQVGRRSS